MHPESPADFVPATMLTVGGLLAVIATVPAFRAARGRRTGSTFPRIAAVAVDMENFAFGPETITAAESIAPGQSTQITFDAGSGTFRFHCRRHDPGMEGELKVQ